MNTKIVVMVLLAGVLFAGAVFAENETEEITLTTYYPAPYGEYENLYVAGTVGIANTSPGTYGVSPDAASVVLDVGTASGTGYVAVDDIYIKNPKTGSANWLSSIAGGGAIDFTPALANATAPAEADRGTKITVTTTGTWDSAYQTVVIKSDYVANPVRGAILSFTKGDIEDMVLGLRTPTTEIPLGRVFAQGYSSSGDARVYKTGDFVIVPLESGSIDLKKIEKDGKNGDVAIRVIAWIK